MDKCTSFWGHKFEARYDEIPPPELGEDSPRYEIKSMTTTNNLGTE